jgi:hypothetical protein
MVFDSRLWAEPPAPVLSTDSGVSGMQHMGIMKTFLVAQGSVVSTNATIYTLAGPHGSLSATNPVLAFGQSKTINISAASGYSIIDVLVDGVSVGVTSQYAFVSVTNNRSLTAYFADNSLRLTVINPTGPDSGSNQVSAVAGSQQACVASNSPVTLGTTQYVVLGWTASGSAPAAGATNATGAFTLTNETVVTWYWTTNYWFNGEAGSLGSLSAGDQWAAFGSEVTVTATPIAYCDFAAWSGDVAPESVSNNPVTVTMGGPRAVAAGFSERLTVHNVPEWWLASFGWTNDFAAAAESDQDHDTILTWQEHLSGTGPTNELSYFRVETRGRAVASDCVVSWPAVSGRVYDVDIMTNVLTDAWAPFRQGLAPTPPDNVFTGRIDAGDSLLIRVRVRR